MNVSEFGLNENMQVMNPRETSRGRLSGVTVVTKAGPAPKIDAELRQNDVMAQRRKILNIARSGRD